MWYKLYFFIILDVLLLLFFFLDVEILYKEGSIVLKCVKIGGCVSNFNGFNGSGSFNIGSGLNGSGLNGNDGV